MSQLPAPVTGPWTLKALRAGELGSPHHGRTVFSCFHCGGGSSMGYKLAGFKVLGGVEIDPKMMALYRKNHSPDERLSFLMGVQDFNVLPDSQVPPELFDLDVLDGSPPCSTFSMSGNRESDWGKDRMFAEGQAKQVLSDLFFDFIQTAEKLRPKVIVAENVRGMVTGNAKWYVKQVFEKLRAAGYETQLFLLNSALMGVPQARERVFFVSRRADLNLPKLDMDFCEQPIALGSAFADLGPQEQNPLCKVHIKLWKQLMPGGKPRDIGYKSCFNFIRLSPQRPCVTLTAQPWHYAHWDECRMLSGPELVRVQSFPDDYDFLTDKARKIGYVCGMSVPPLMMQRVALKVAGILLGAQ